MNKWLAIALAAALSGGCASVEERAANAQREMEEAIRVQGPACERLGYKADTDPWRDCVLRLSFKEDVERAARRPMLTSCVRLRGGFVSCSGI